MPQGTRYVIAYDVSDDGRRTRLAKMLLDYGDRIQHSVFEANLAEGDVERILRRAQRLIDEQEDSFRLYPLCGECVGKVRCLGRDTPLTDEDLVIV